MRGIILHYIGNRVYDRERFEREVQKYGVARAMPMNVIKKLNFGDKIFLAFYKKDEEGRRYAEIFGYFIVGGIHYTGSKELKERIMKDDRIKIREVSDGGEVVVRGCGSYVVSGTAVLDESVDLKTLITVIEEHSKELGEKVRVMVTGTYYPLPEVKKLYNVKFTRSILRLEDITEEELLGKTTTTEITERKAVQVEDYNLRKYLSKKDKEALMTKTLDAWLKV